MNKRFLHPKRKLLILHPSKFTEFYYYKYELFYFERKNYEVIIHDLSNISYSRQYNKLWKTKREKKLKEKEKKLREKEETTKDTSEIS